MKENVREKEKTRLLQEASSLFNELINFSTSLVSGKYAILQIKITKISKEDHYYIGTNLEEIKNSKKKKKVSKSSQIRRGCKIARVA